MTGMTDTCTIKGSEFTFHATLANFFFSISSTQQILGKAFTILQNLQISFSSSANLTFVILKKRKDIPRIISILILANMKVFSKNQIFFRLFEIENLVVAILWVFKAMPLIFWALTLVFQGLKPSFAT